MKKMAVPKFRAWYAESGTMYEVKSLIFTLKSMLCVNKNALYPERTLYFDDDNVELMQSTGVFDKDGKEIFEGDIVKRTSLIPGGFELFGWDLESACHCTQAEAQKYFPECEWIPLKELK